MMTCLRNYMHKMFQNLDIKSFLIRNSLMNEIWHPQQSGDRERKIMYLHHIEHVSVGFAFIQDSCLNHQQVVLDVKM